MERIEHLERENKRWRLLSISALLALFVMMGNSAAICTTSRMSRSSSTTSTRSGPLPPDASLFEIVNDYERQIISERLERCNWSQTEAAESLHVPLSTLNQKIKRLDIKIRKKSEV